MKMNFNIAFQIQHENQFDMSKFAMEIHIRQAIEEYLKNQLNQNTCGNVQNINCCILNCYTEEE